MSNRARNIGDMQRTIQHGDLGTPILKTKAQSDAEHQAWADQQPATTRCALCGWKWEGTAIEGRERARLHRLEHPELAGRRYRRGMVPMRERGLRVGEITDPDDMALAQKEAEWRRERAKRDAA